TPAHLGVDLIRTLRPHQGQAAPAEPGAAEPSADDALRIDQGPVQVDQRRTAALVVRDRALARIGHERTEPIETAAIPGVESLRDPRNFAENVRGTAGYRAFETMLVARVLFHGDVAEHRGGSRAPSRFEKDPRRLGAFADPAVVVGRDERLIDTREGQQD